MKRDRTLRVRWAARWWLVALLGVAIWVGSTSTAQAVELQPGFGMETVFSALEQPTAVAFSPDGRVFVAEKSGIVKVFDGLGDAQPEVFADLRTQVFNYWDRGLLGLELHPNFPATPFVYVAYTLDKQRGRATVPRWGVPGATADNCADPPGPTDDGCATMGRLSRLTAGGNAMVGEELPLLEDWCGQFPSHTVGDVGFGPDGMLYVSGGDGASFTFVDWGQRGGSGGVAPNPCGDPPVPAGGAQTPPSAQGGALRSQDMLTPADPATLGGTVIRIDPTTAAGAPGNPFATSTDANARRIIASGMRNPFRFAFRPDTFELWVGDVGWATWEELNLVADVADGVAENFGWPCYEGPGRQEGYEAAGLALCEKLYAAGPAAVDAAHWTYEHGDHVDPDDSCPTGDSSITGLAFYEGGAYPAAYAGGLFIADFARKCVWLLPAGQDGLPDGGQAFVFAEDLDGGYVDLEIGPGGDLYAVDILGSEVHRFVRTNVPAPAISASPAHGPSPLTVGLDASGSRDPNPGDVLSYAWDLDGDGAFDDGTSPAVSWTYTGVGDVVVGLRATDQHGNSDIARMTINVGTLPALALATPGGTAWTVGQAVPYSGSAVDPQDGALGAASLSWTLIMHHCPSSCHTHRVTTVEGQTSGAFTAPDHEYPSHLELRLTAKDSDGHEHTASSLLHPTTVDLGFASTQQGQLLAVGEHRQPTPFSRRVIVGSSNSVAAPPSQLLDGTLWTFSGWSDGGARAREIRAPAVPTIYHAAYVERDPPTVAVADALRRRQAPLRANARLTAVAEDNHRVASVEFMVDGASVGAIDERSPFVMKLRTRRLSNGRHKVRAVARDPSGNRTVSKPVRITVDNVRPTAKLIEPRRHAAVSGPVRLRAKARDRERIRQVRFRVNGKPLGRAVRKKPFARMWNTTRLEPGRYRIAVVARDLAGNVTRSRVVPVTVVRR